MDSETRRQKQQELMAALVERKIRLHASQLYHERGQVEGFALQDWVQAESDVLRKTIQAPLYRKTRAASSQTLEAGSAESELAPPDSSSSS